MPGRVAPGLFWPTAILFSQTWENAVLGRLYATGQDDTWQASREGGQSGQRIGTQSR